MYSQSFAQLNGHEMLSQHTDRHNGQARSRAGDSQRPTRPRPEHAIEIYTGSWYKKHHNMHEVPNSRTGRVTDRVVRDFLGLWFESSRATKYLLEFG